MIEISGWAESDVGKVRETNEDRYYCNPELGVFAVADGIGGKPGGEVASQAVVDGIAACAGEFREFIETKSFPLTKSDRDDIFAHLTGSVQAINHQVYHRATTDGFPRGIGSTLDLVVLAPAGAFVLHVGDSRVYLVRDDEIFRITSDHTFEQHLRNNPVLQGDHKSPEKYSHVLTNSIGRAPGIEIDQLFVDIRSGDRLIACSDGITDYLGGQEILEFCKRDDKDLPRRLIETANERGGKDNSTVVVAAVTGDGDARFVKRPTRPDTFQRVRFLDTIELFAELEFQELLKVVRYLHSQQYNAGEAVVSQGDEVDGLYFVMHGELIVEVDGRQISTVGPDEHFGEFALFGKPARSADVRCHKDCQVLFMRGKDLKRLVREEPVLGNKLLISLLGRTSQIIQEMLEDSNS